MLIPTYDVTFGNQKSRHCTWILDIVTFYMILILHSKLKKIAHISISKSSIEVYTLPQPPRHLLQPSTAHTLYFPFLFFFNSHSSTACESPPPSLKTPKNVVNINQNFPKMEGWFSSSTSPSDDQQKPASSSSSSLLADWNSYATSQQEQDPSNSAISFDLESAVRSANNSVTGTFSV